MLTESLRTFIRDERGSYTIWSLIWFLMYVAIGGLAVDLTDAYQKEHQLQAAADAAALAGAMALGHPTEDPVNTARLYAKANMDQNIHGTVLTSDDVVLGTWVSAQEQFYKNTPEPNAVYVTTRRAEKNHNQVAMNFLRVLSLVGIPAWWNINTEAVAVRYPADCLRNGFVAALEVWFNNDNDFYNNICIHGQWVGVGHNGAVSGNSYAEGVSISMGTADGNNFNPNHISEDLAQALKNGGIGDLLPLEAYASGSYVKQLALLPTLDHATFSGDRYEKYHSWDFLYANHDGSEGIDPPKPRSSLPGEGEEFEEYAVYDIKNCNGQINLGSGVELRNVAIIADCPLHVAANMRAGNVILASTHTGSNAAVHIAAQAQLGDPDYCKNVENGDPDGGVEIYAPGDSDNFPDYQYPGNVHLAAQQDWHGVRIAATGDVGLAAQNDVYGVSVQAGGTIDFQSNGDYGLCPNSIPPGPIEWRVKLVR